MAAPVCHVITPGSQRRPPQEARSGLQWEVAADKRDRRADGGGDPSGAGRQEQTETWSTQPRTERLGPTDRPTPPTDLVSSHT